MQDTAGVTERRYRFESKNGRVRCFELNDGVRGAEVAASLNFHERAWLDDYKACIAAEMLPLVAVYLRPSEMPAELEAMPADAEIVLRDASGQYDYITTASRARERVQQAIERNRRGVINIKEAAAMLALADGGGIRDYVDMLQDAAKDGNLELADEGTPMRAVDNKARADFLAKSGLVHKGYLTAFTVTTPAAVNRCLDQIDTLGVIARLPTAAALPSPAPQASPEQVQAAPADKLEKTESPEARQGRRLSRLRELGADFIPHGTGWRVDGKRGALAKLEREERKAGRPMSDKTDIRKDLQASVEREREGRPPAS